MAELAPRHVAVERFAIELEPRREALDDRDQAGTVGLARSCEPQSHAGSVDGDDSRPRAQGCDAIATSAPMARNGANGIVRLRAFQPWRSEQDHARDRPGGEGDHHRLDHGGAQVYAEHAGELDVAEAHAVRANQRRREQEGGGTEPRDQPRGHPARIGQQADGNGDREARHQGAVGDQPGAQVADRDHPEQGDERGVEQRGGHIVESAMTPELSPPTQGHNA